MAARPIPMAGRPPQRLLIAVVAALLSAVLIVAAAHKTAAPPTSTTVRFAYDIGPAPDEIDPPNDRTTASSLSALERSATVRVGHAPHSNLSRGSACRVSCPSAPNTTGLRTVEQAGMAPSDALRIQNAANRTHQRITVVGSRAEGTAGPLSDWDYIFSGPSHARPSAKTSVPRGKAGGELDIFGRETGIDRWQDYNPGAPGYNPLDPLRPHVIFGPQ